MLVRNLTQGSLNIKGLSGKKLSLPPLKVIDIDGLDFPAERLKKQFGRYIHILTEKVEEPKHEEVPTKPQEDLELKEGEGSLPPADETASEEEKDKNIGAEDNDKDADTEDTNNDSDDVDELVDSILEEIEGEDAGKEEVTTEEPVAKKPAKSSKKAAKKAKK